MEPRYPQTILNKSNGTTDSEKYLSTLCQRSFLSMWSYPNIFRDCGNDKEGKEICDLLVIFDKHIIIFSDKRCAFSNSGNIQVDWSRWYRKTVQKSADQIYGAERWLLNYPERVFLDKNCLQKLPLAIPAKDEVKIHRILVAHAASKECIAQLGGSGSLMICPRIVGDMHYSDGVWQCLPFVIGQVHPTKGFVHVFDDTSLAIVMETLDTVSDFILYLERKERFLNSGKLVVAAGEEELLAFYLLNTTSDGKHDFIIEPNAAGVSITEGHWEKFVNHPQRKAQIKANEISYAWDELIGKFLKNIFAGTSRLMSHASISAQEKGLQFLARENRLRRRILSEALIGLITKTPSNVRGTRTVLPSSPGDPYYVFLVLPITDSLTYDEYREIRFRLLYKYCSITKLNFPDAVDIIGIATEDLSVTERSEDFGYFDARNWTDLDAKQAEDDELSLRESGLISKQNRYERIYQEFPDPNYPKKDLKGAYRNKPCPCGSGKKYKKCCGS